jgi:hypothetical protein
MFGNRPQPKQNMVNYKQHMRNTAWFDVMAKDWHTEAVEKKQYKADANIQGKIGSNHFELDG